jgi:hypothetical protein
MVFVRVNAGFGNVFDGTKLQRIYMKEIIKQLNPA